MDIKKLKPLSVEFMEKAGFSWHTDIDNSAYISDEIVEISQSRQMLIMGL